MKISFLLYQIGRGMTYVMPFNSAKIQRELNWTPVETFESGIRKTVRWYLDNEDWCLRVQDGSYKGSKSLK